MAGGTIGSRDSGGGGSSTSSSSRIGEFIHKKSGFFTDDADAMAKGYLPVKSGTVLNGAITYPIWAAVHTEFVSGDDIVFPADVDGMFLRNSQGNATAEGSFQDSENKAHTHDYTDTNHPQFVSQGNGSNVARRGIANTAKTTTSSGDTNESRPANRAYQLYTIVDTYS